MSQISLKAMLELVDKATAPLKNIIGSSERASDALRAQREELRKLNKAQSDITSFKRLSSALKGTRKDLEAARQTVSRLAQQHANVQHPTRAMIKELEKAKQSVRSLKQVEQDQLRQLQMLRNGLREAGIDTKSLSRHERELRSQIQSSTQALERRQQQLDRQAASQRRLNELTDKHRKIQSKLSSAAAKGMVMAGTGVAAFYQLQKPLNESKNMDLEQNRIAALGLGDDVAEKAVKYAKAMDTFGTSILDNTVLIRDGMTVFADLHHAEMVAPTLAKMKLSNETMFGHAQGSENERKFMDMLKVIELRGGLKNDEEFKKQANIIQQVITATGGRVEAPEWLNAIKTGGLAVKGMSNEALYYKMESIVQEWGGFRYGTAAMSAYQNIYQGRTTKRAANNMERLGLIEDTSKLKHDKAGQIAYLDVGAIKGSDLFKEDQFAWMEKILLPTLASKGITKKGDVLDAIGSIFTNRTASNLFSDMYLQKDIINKSAKMNAGADNIDQIYGKATNTTAGKELEAKAKLHDAYLVFGQTILPLYTKAIEEATSGLKIFSEWMEKNPLQAKILGNTLLVVAAGLVAIGGLLTIFSPILLAMLSMKFIMTSLGIKSLGLINVIKLVGNAFIWLGKGIFLVGRLMMANPLFLAIGLLAIAAYMIYRNWGPIKQFFIALWGSISAGASNLWLNLRSFFSSGIANISATIINWSPIGLFYRAFAAVMSYFGIQLPSTFTGFGQMLMQGLANGIGNSIGAVIASAKAAAGTVVTTVKSAFGIHSPSRVFAELGAYNMQGLANGITGNSGLANTAVSKTSQDMLGFFDTSAIRFDQRPSIAASQKSAVPASAPVQQVFNIYPAPGMDEQALSQMIAMEVAKAQRLPTAANARSYSDQD